MEETIHGIYEAVETPQLWESAGARIAGLVGGRGVHLMLLDGPLPGTPAHLNTYLLGDPDGAREYLEDYAPLDFRYGRIMRNPRGEMIEERAYVTEEEARTSPIHQELFPKYDTFNLTGANLSVGESTGWFGISTRSADTPFDAGQIATLGRIAPHLHRAFSLLLSRNRLAREREAAYAALDAGAAGMVLFSGGEARHANAQALALLERGFLCLRRGRMGAAQPAQDRKLRNFFAQAVLAAAPQALAVTDPASGDTYHLRLHLPAQTALLPVAARAAGDMTLSITLFSRKAAPDRAAVKAFAAAHGLPPSEAATVAAVIGDIDLAEAAKARGISLDTVRKQLKSTLARLDLKSQKQLVRLFEAFRMTRG